MSHITTRTCAASASLVQRVLFVIKRLYGILLILVDKEPASGTLKTPQAGHQKKLTGAVRVSQHKDSGHVVVASEQVVFGPGGAAHARDTSTCHGLHRGSELEGPALARPIRRRINSVALLCELELEGCPGKCDRRLGHRAAGPGGP
jgi:hypothetical protein